MRQQWETHPVNHENPVILSNGIQDYRIFMIYTIIYSPSSPSLSPSGFLIPNFSKRY